MIFNLKWTLTKTFVESRFRVIWVYMYQTKGNSSGDICWVSVWSYISLRVSNKSEFLWITLLSLSLKLCKFMSFKQKRILMNKFFESQFEDMKVYEFQTKANSYEDNSWVSVVSYISLCVSNQCKFSWRHLLSLIFKLCKFMSFKQKRTFMRKFVKPQFGVM